MKKTLLIFVILLVKVSAMCQTTSVSKRVPHKGDYIKDTSIDSYIGTWEWNDGNNLFRIELKKTKKTVGTSDNSFDIDVIEGGYLYKKNDITIVNTLSYADSAPPLIGGGLQQNQIDLTLIDKVKEKRGDLILKLSGFGKNQLLTWTLKNPTEVISIGKKYDPTFSVPIELTLKRKI